MPRSTSKPTPAPAPAGGAARSPDNPRPKRAGSSRTQAKPRAKKATETTSLLLRDISPDVLEVLRSRAQQSGRSLQQELHVALRRDARRNFDEARAMSDSWHSRLQGRKLPSSSDLLREDRER